MWLINVHSMTLESVADPSSVQFAALSHTWEHEEVSFQDFVGHRELARLMAGYQKVEMVCALARAQGLGFAWIDTCCIDKTSSAELSEAINSMFQWYRGSAACFVYLSDLHDPTPPSREAAAAGPGSHHGPADLLSRLRKCRWFTRGWTLQELIAPTSVEFFDAKWREVGTKASLVKQLSEITTIPQSVLLDSAVMYDMPAGRRMSWAAHRTTTRIEDRAYSIIGIFDINMPMLYGEGNKAFIRLQEEIVKETNDLSLFAWQESETARPSRYRGLFAKSPDEFQSCQTLETSEISVVKELDFSITNNGVRFATTLWIDAGRGFTMNLNCV
ncbi:HET-domain-containing protein, partial [Thozetella sp. PMI_491]